MKLKAGRKPLPPEKKKHLVAAYMTNEDKELIIKHYGSLTQAVVHEILQKLHATKAIERQEEIFLSHK
jgi:hypothetical protein